MSYELYKLLHLLGILITFMALGGLALAAAGGNRSGGGALGAVTHGLGLVIVLVSGFGLLARLGAGFPLWVVLKLVIWLLLGAALVVLKRAPSLARVMWVVIPLLGGLAAWLVLFGQYQAWAN